MGGDAEEKLRSRAENRKSHGRARGCVHERTTSDRQARAAYRPGMTADELRVKIDLAPYRERIAHGDAFIGANFDGMIRSSAIDRMSQQLAGRMKAEGLEP